MGKDRDRAADGAAPLRHGHRTSKSSHASESEPDPDSDSEEGPRKSEARRRRSKSRSKTRASRKRSRDSDSLASSSDYDSESESDPDNSSDSEEERRRRRRERRKEKQRKEKKRKRREEERKMKDKKSRDKKKVKDKGKKGAVTNSWGKYGIIKETDMWNKRPEFIAWLAEVKQVNSESLSNWEEKRLFKDFMEDHNTATFPSKKYYDIDAYEHAQMKKKEKRGHSKVKDTERTVFNDEEQRRQELRIERERQREEQVVALKHSMQSGMAQAMKEQAQLREEMAYQYKLGNFEAAAAIQRRLDPDIAM
ncbi:hypothetical protein F511_31663 [Dorcoceras hygrometricum]|uniref:Uncharacterized protein n=1 Tax=Dorcoceras hygrometricum TaxID=472368 RepID=A0A2Z7AY46_9LAMI|nr:hypothetical protein F511_31663 [Dorcoceras hygrometricum]